MYGCTVASMLKLEKILHKTCMCKWKLNNKYIFNRTFITYFKLNYSSKVPTEHEHLNNKDDKRNLIPNFDGKYKVFTDKDAPIIFDINEETERIALTDLNIEEKDSDLNAELNITHGINGVFEIEDFVKLLQLDKNIKNIFVATVPKDYNYVDYIVVVTGISPKHMQALIFNVRKTYKAIRYKNDIIPVIEGENCKDWIALDLGNIAFHVFSEKARLKYDLETLWAVGSKYDDITNKKVELNVIEKYKEFLKILQPVE